MNKHILHLPKALSELQCKVIIKTFNSKKIQKKLGPNNEFCKKNNLYYYEYITLSTKSPIFANELSEGLTRYSKLHKFLTSAGFPKWKPYEKCNLQKYQPSHYYAGEHCEHSNSQQTSKRVLAWMFYLNDINSGGGGTYFPQQELTIKANQGDLYIWPAGWTHSHIGIPAKSEEKYIITGWCVFI